MTNCIPRSLVISFISFLLLAISARGQNAAQLLGTFNHVCSDYQYAPLQMDVDILTVSNVITSDKDTLHVRGSFDIGKRSSFFRINTQEEVVTDSVLLIADNKNKKMILSFQKTPSSDELLSSFRQTFLSDSNMHGALNAYTIVSATNNTIDLTSKDTIENSVLPTEEITAYFDPAHLEPKDITLTRREKYKIQQSMYDSLSILHAYKPYLINEDGQNYFLVKETKLITHFIRIAHKEEPDQRIDRYLSMEQQKYVPANVFKNYQLTILGKF